MRFDSRRDCRYAFFRNPRMKQVKLTAALRAEMCLKGLQHYRERQQVRVIDRADNADGIVRELLQRDCPFGKIVVCAIGSHILAQPHRQASGTQGGDQGFVFRLIMM